MEKKITIQNIADMAGVSKGTVSRYLNHGYISDEKAERIRKVVAATGFQSNFFASRLKLKQSHLIGVVLPCMDSVTVGKLLTGINRVFEPEGYQALLLVSSLKKNKELENILHLQQQGVDGIIVDSLGITNRHLQVLRNSTVPIFFTGQQHKDVHYIKIDDYGAGRMMGAYIQQMGHRQVVFAGVSERDAAVGIERKQGFIDAFSEGHPEVRIDFVETGFDFFSAYGKGDDVLQLHPTAVVCATDNIGLGLLRYFHERHIPVPGEISIAGFGGYDDGAVSYPSLTTVAFDYELAGMKTAQGLLDMLQGRPLVFRQQLPMFFIERESVRCLDIK